MAIDFKKGGETMAIFVVGAYQIDSNFLRSVFKYADKGYGRVDLKPKGFFFTFPDYTGERKFSADEVFVDVRADGIRFSANTFLAAGTLPEQLESYTTRATLLYHGKTLMKAWIDARFSRGGAQYVEVHVSWPIGVRESFE